MSTEQAAPQLVTRVDLGVPMEPLPDRTPGGQPYRKALMTVELHGMPVAVTEVEVTPRVATPPTVLAALLWPRIRSQVNEHLARDGAAPLTALDPWRGITDVGNGTGPACRTFPTGGLAADDVSVVVPTLGRSPVLRRLVRSVLDGNMRPREILLVVNDPDDRSVEELVQHEFADQPVEVVHAQRGAARARNAGAARASGSVLAFLDDDVEVDRHWLTGILRGFGRQTDVSCVTGLIMPASLEAPAQVRLQQFGGFDKGAVPVLYDLQEHAVRHPLYPYLPGIYGSGANVAMRREAFERLAGFDESLGPGTPARGGEDIDLLMRTVLAGDVLAYEPQASVRHHHRDADERLRRTMFGYGRGLGVVMLKQTAEPGTRREVMRRLPQGVRYLLSRSSPKNARTRSEAYPASLRFAELAGIASAPVALKRSRVRTATEV
jgi:glycosyltransferase involved in cell wall biosynthesis